MTDDFAVWLRKQITADLDAARIISAGGFEPQRWDTNPPGQVNPEPVSYRDGLNAVLVPDPEDRRDREGLPYWVEVVSYDRLIGEPPEADCRNDDLPVMLVGDGRREVDHIIRNDPRSAAADCEAKLFILDEHQPVDVPQVAWRGCGTCKDPSGWPATFPCRTVRLLGCRYRFRAGYREVWTP